MSKKIEDFIPREAQKKEVNIYSCGPTVYDVAHIGNFRSYIFADVLAKSLRLGGYKVRNTMNITDIDDKTIRKLLEKKSDPNLDDLKDYTQPFIAMFFDDIQKMNIDKATYYPKATEHIKEMLKLIQRLIQQKIAYEKDGSIYFSIKKKHNYGKLSQLDLSAIKTGQRYNTDEYSKEDIRDFVLWKKTKPEEHLAWDSPFGKGRPGWHLECSAMVHHIFKNQLDIHTGGTDLIFPHHENEIAQSETAFGGELSRYWMHCEHLLINGKKMSKSLDNFYTLRDLLSRGYNAMAIRYLLISVPYRKKINFTLEALDQAGQTIRGIWGSYNRVLSTKEIQDKSDKIYDDIIQNYEKFKNQFLDDLKNDLNTAKALATFHHFLGQVNTCLNIFDDVLPKNLKQCILNYFSYYDSVISILSHHRDLIETESIPKEIWEILKARNLARSEKNFSKADQLREKILEAGYEILDSKNTDSQLRKLNPIKKTT